MLVLLLLPLICKCIYPALERCGANLQPLNRMPVGMVFACAAFLLTAWLQTEINSNPVQECTNMTNDDSMHTEHMREKTGPQGGVSIYLQIPQYVVMACGEILASPSSLQFAYSAAPTSFKSVVIACYYTTVMVGNLLAGIMYTVGSNLERVEMALLFAGLMFLNAMVFLCLRRSYLFEALARQPLEKRWPSLAPRPEDHLIDYYRGLSEALH
jgi:dipeptide/tripeptide permease